MRRCEHERTADGKTCLDCGHVFAKPAERPPEVPVCKHEHVIHLLDGGPRCEDCFSYLPKPEVPGESAECALTQLIAWLETEYRAANGRWQYYGDAAACTSATTISRTLYELRRLRSTEDELRGKLGESAELAAIRARDVSCCSIGAIPDRRALLRMVDELTACSKFQGSVVGKLIIERDELTFVSESRGRRILELESYAQASAKERVELEAKLVSTEGSLRRTQEAFEAAEQAWRARVVERDAKLVEAENDCANLRTIARANLKRAEAAEARVRELEDRHDYRSTLEKP